MRNENNETLLRKLAFSNDFSFGNKNGQQANEGSVIITTQHPCLYSLKEKREVGRKRLRYAEIMMKAEGIPPASDFITNNANLANPIIYGFTISCTEGCLAFDKDEKPLEKFND